MVRLLPWLILITISAPAAALDHDAVHVTVDNCANIRPNVLERLLRLELGPELSMGTPPTKHFPAVEVRCRGEQLELTFYEGRHLPRVRRSVQAARLRHRGGTRLLALAIAELVVVARSEPSPAAQQRRRHRSYPRALDPDPFDQNFNRGPAPILKEVQPTPPSTPDTPAPTPDDQSATVKDNTLDWPAMRFVPTLVPTPVPEPPSAQPARNAQPVPKTQPAPQTPDNAGSEPQTDTTAEPDTSAAPEEAYAATARRAKTSGTAHQYLALAATLMHWPAAKSGTTWVGARVLARHRFSPSLSAEIASGLLAGTREYDGHLIRGQLLTAQGMLRVHPTRDFKSATFSLAFGGIVGRAWLQGEPLRELSKHDRHQNSFGPVAEARLSNSRGPVHVGAAASLGWLLPAGARSEGDTLLSTTGTWVGLTVDLGVAF